MNLLVIPENKAVLVCIIKIGKNSIKPIDVKRTNFLILTLFKCKIKYSIPTNIKPNVWVKIRIMFVNASL